MGIVTARVVDRLLKSLYPAGLGYGLRGGKARMTPMGTPKYDNTTARVPKAAAGEWMHAARAITPKARPSTLLGTATAAAQVFPKAQAHDFLRGFHVRHGDYHSRVVRLDGWSQRNGNPAIQVHGHVFHTPTGKKVGEFHREFERYPSGDVEAHHGEFVINQGHQGSGFGTHFAHEVEQHYRKAGVKRIHMTANYDIGGYIWAMHGYDFANRGERHRVLSEYKKYLAENHNTTFKRRSDIPNHSQDHPVHAWEIAAHQVQNKGVLQPVRSGKNFLTSDKYGTHYQATKELDGGEGYKVGLAYQRSHMMRGRALEQGMGKAGQEEDAACDTEMDRKRPEGLERYMEPWHQDENGDSAARNAVERVVDEAHGRPKTVVDAPMVDTVTPPELKKSLWQEYGDWFASEDWIDLNAEPFGLMKASVNPVKPIRAAGGGMIANKPSGPIAPKVAHAGITPKKLERPSMPAQAGVTVPAKDVPRRPDGKIDWMSVTPGSSFWVTIKSPDSPLEGRAIRITKRGNGMKGVAVAHVGQTNIGGIKPIRSMEPQLKREEKQLGVSAEHVRRVGEAADTSKMSSKDVHAASETHGRFAAREQTPEQQAEKARFKEKSDAPAARGARREQRKAIRHVEKTIGKIHNTLVRAILDRPGHEEGEKPPQLEEKDLARQLTKISGLLQEDRKFKSLSPHTQDMLVHSIRNAATKLDNWTRDQQRLAAEMEARKANNRFANEYPLPTDIGEAGVEVPSNKKVVSHIDGPGKGRHMILTKSVLDDVLAAAQAIENGVDSAAVGQDKVADILTGAIDQNVKAAEAAENPNGATPEQQDAKAALEAAAKDPKSLAIKPGRRKNSMKSYLRDVAHRLTSKTMLKHLDALDVARAGLAEAAERDRSAADLFKRAQTSQELGPWLLEARKNTEALEDLATLLEKGDPLSEERVSRAQAIDPAMQRKVFDQMGSHYNSRRITSDYGAELLALKYGGIEGFGTLPPVTDIEPPNVDTLDPKQIHSIIAEHPEKGGDAILHCGPYFQAQALRKFEEVRTGYKDLDGQPIFKGIEAKNMRNFVRLYGLEVAAHLFAHHLYKNFVVDIKNKDAAAPEYTGPGASKMKPQTVENRGWEQLAGQHEQQWQMVIERMRKDAVELNPVTEQNMIRNEKRLEDQRDAIQSSYQDAVKRKDEGSMTDALLRMQALTASGAQNAGMHLGSMMAHWELMHAMKHVSGDYRQKDIGLTSDYGEDKELAEVAAKRIFKFGWESHVKNQGTPEKPSWAVTGTVGQWLKDGAKSIDAAQEMDERRTKLRSSDETRSDYDPETGERWARDDSFSDDGDAGTWIRPGGKYVKEGVRLKEGQRSAVEVLHQGRTGILDHTTGFGKTAMSILHGLNEIGHAEKQGKQHRMVILHGHDDVWDANPETSSWKFMFKDDAPIHHIKRGATTVAASTLRGLKSKSGVVILNHRDMTPDVKKALREADVHTVLIDEPQTPGMVLTPKGGYTKLAQYLYSGEGTGQSREKPIISGQNQMDHSGAHLVLSSATLANPDQPKAMYKQLKPLLKRAGSDFGSQKQWSKVTSAVGSLSPSAQPNTMRYLTNLLGNVQTSNPKYRYAFKIKPHEHTAALTSEQHSAVAQWATKDSYNKIINDDLLKEPPKGGIGKDDFETIGPRTAAEYKRNLDLYEASKPAGVALSDADKRRRATKRTEWLRMVEQKRREYQAEAVFGMPRSAFKQFTSAKGAGESLIKKHAPVWDDFLSSVEAGHKSIMNMNGSRYLCGVAKHLTQMRMAKLHGGKSSDYHVEVVHVGKQAGETRAQQEKRIGDAIARYNAYPDEHSAALIFDGPLSGKNIGRADHVVDADGPRDESGHVDVGLMQQFSGRAMRQRGKRDLHTHHLMPKWVPAMDDQLNMRRQLNSQVAYNPAMSATGGIFKKSLWVGVRIGQAIHQTRDVHLRTLVRVNG